jgi:GNAT superfamily N-acetyltransferase
MADNWPTPRSSGDRELTGELVIRELSPEESLDDLTELLHRSYKALADMGLNYVATYQDISITRKRTSQGVAFVAELKGALVGTIVYTRPENTHIPRQNPIPQAGKLNQLAVEPGLQGLGIGKRLFIHAEEYARAHGASALALDTAESAAHLVSWYERMGYKFVEYIQWDITNYRSVVLVKYLR